MPIIMEQPTNYYGIIMYTINVVEVVKSIYNAKNSGRICVAVLNKDICSRGFKNSSYDSRIYFLRRGNFFVIIVAVQDDLISVFNDRQLLETIKISNLRFVKLLM